MAVIVRRSTLVAGFALAILALTAFAPVACAATYTWGVSGSGGDGTWSTAGIWNGSTWNNATPDSAVFAGTGGTVSLTTTQTTGSITFDAFTGGFTIGTLGGQTLRINGGGMTMNAGAGAVTINSPVTLGAVQSWTNNSTSLLTVAGNVTNGGNLLTVAGSGNTTIAGGVSGAGGLTMSGAGTLTLSGTNSYTGATTVNGGTLALTGGWAGTMGNITVSNTAAISIQSGSYALGNNTFFVGGDTPGTVNQTGGVVTFAGGVQLLVGNGGGAGAYTLSGGTVTTAASTTFGVMLGVNTNASGTFTMTGGALNMTAATGGGGDATLSIGRSSSTGENGQSGAFIQSGGVASVGLLSMGGNGSNAGTGGSQVLTLTGGTFAANQFPRLSAGNSNVATITIGGSADVTLPAFPTTRGTGATATLYFNGGTLRPAAASATYMSGLTSASIQSGGATIDVASGRDITIGQSLLADGTSPGGGLTKNGAGTLTLSAANTFTGTTRIGAGTLTLSNPAALQNSTLDMNAADAGTIAFAVSGTNTYALGGLIGSRNVVTSGAVVLSVGGNATSGTYSGVLSGGGALLKSGSGTLTLSTTNTFSGSTTVSAGVLALSGSGSIGSSSGVNISGSGARLDISGASGDRTVVSLEGVAGSSVLLGGNALTADNATNKTFAGVISGSGGFTKAGAGTLTLAGSNSYTGPTTINAGVLQIGVSGTGTSLTIANASFETPTTSSFIYTPTGASVGWTFDAASGIAKNTFFTTAPPAGSQAGFIQTTGSFYQSITTATAGFYGVTFQAQGRGGALGPDGVIVQMDGVTSGSWAATDVSQSQWLTYTSTVYLTSGSHTLTFLGNNTGGGDKSVSIDNVRAFQSTTGGSLPSTTAVSLAGSGATFDLNGTAQTIGSLSGIAGSSVTKGFLTVGGDGTSTTFAGSMSTTTLTKVGVGTLTLSGSNSFLSDQPASVAINAGVLALGNSGALGSSGTIAFGGGTLQFSASNTIDYSGRFSTAASQAYSLDTNGQNVSLGTALSSSGGSLTKLGSGTLTLSDAQAFTGTARVDAGTLAISGSSTLATANRIYVASGASLDATAAGLGVVGGQTLGGYGTVSGNLAVLAGGTLSPGGSVGTLTETGNTTWHGGMHYLFEVNVASGTAGGPNGWDLFNTSGSLTLVDGNVSPIAIDLTSLSGTSSGSAADFDPNIDYAWKFVVAGSEITTFNAGWFTVNSTAFQNLPSNPERFYVARGDQLGAINATGSANELYVVYAAVPEPGTLALAGIGIAAVGWRLRRRRR